MLTIRPEQLQSFSAHLLHQFEQRMVLLLKTRWPGPTRNTSDLDLVSWVRQAMHKAGGYAIVSELDMERFLVWMWPRSLNFDRLPALAWAVQILANHHLSATEKLNELDNYEAMIARPTP